MNAREFSDLFSEPSVKLVGIDGSMTVDKNEIRPVIDHPTHFNLSAQENLCEYAGRVCYDSFFKEKSRESEAYHKHILEVGHLSVYEHTNIFIMLLTDSWSHTDSLLAHMAMRPGLMASIEDADGGVAVMFNPRVVLDWDKHGVKGMNSHLSTVLRNTLAAATLNIMPNVLDGTEGFDDPDLDDAMQYIVYFNRPVDFRTVSVHITCSRGCSHELVRHRNMTAFSQRSTRYCNEFGSKYVAHPLLLDAIKANPEFNETVSQTVGQMQFGYHQTGRILDGMSVPLKQSRGASRWCLGTALETQLVMTATIGAWDQIFEQRISEHADAEISLVCKMIKEIVDQYRED